MTAAIQTNVPTLADMLRARDTSHLPLEDRIDLTGIVMPLFEDMPMLKCNAKNSDTYVSARRTDLQEAEIIDYNEGFPIGTNRGDVKSSSPTSFGTANKVNCRLCRDQENPAKYRNDENSGAKQALTQKVAKAFFYSNKQEDSRAFKGLAELFDHTSTDKKNVGYNVINAGGTTGNACTSIYLLALGKYGVHGIYPKNTKDTIIEMLGKGPVDKEEKGKVDSWYYDKFEMNVGLHLANYQSCVRIANIDTNWFAEAAKGEDGAMKDIDALMIQALGKIPAFVKKQSFKLMAYMPQEVITAWTLYNREKFKTGTSPLDHAGKDPTETLFTCKTAPGIQVRVEDCLMLTEDVLGS